MRMSPLWWWVVVAGRWSQLRAVEMQHSKMLCIVQLRILTCTRTLATFALNQLPRLLNEPLLLKQNLPLLYRNTRRLERRRSSSKHMSHSRER
jgi:hypothetical protein